MNNTPEVFSAFDPAPHLFRDSRGSRGHHPLRAERPRQGRDGLQRACDVTQLHRQVVDGDRLARLAKHGALGHVLQLAHVAGPRVRENLLGRRRDLGQRESVRIARLLQVMLEKQQNIPSSGAERRNLDLNHIEAVVESL